MADSGQQTRVVGCSDMCNLPAEKIRENRLEFDFTLLIMSRSVGLYDFRTPLPYLG